MDSSRKRHNRCISVHFFVAQGVELSGRLGPPEDPVARVGPRGRPPLAVRPVDPVAQDGVGAVVLRGNIHL